MVLPRVAGAGCRPRVRAQPRSRVGMLEREVERRRQLGLVARPGKNGERRLVVRRKRSSVERRRQDVSDLIETRGHDRLPGGHVLEQLRG